MVAADDGSCIRYNGCMWLGTRERSPMTIGLAIGHSQGLSIEESIN